MCQTRREHFKTSEETDCECTLYTRLPTGIFLMHIFGYFLNRGECKPPETVKIIAIFVVFYRCLLNFE